MAKETLTLDYSVSESGLSIPWIEGPFAKEILSKKLLNEEITSKEYLDLYQFITKGYILIDLDLSLEFFDLYKNQINLKIETNLIIQNSGYHYSNSPRIVEAWQDCSTVLDLCKHSKILKFLKLAYGRDPLPFQTINFIKGSNQPLHSDTIHFHTIPNKWMTGVWVAMEDMDENNGTLQYVPGSHQWDVYDFTDLDLPIPEFSKEFDNYHQYEEFLKRLVKVKNAKAEILTCKKGHALVWAANLLHGGISIKDEKRTRHSQAIHYYYKDCKYYYCPLFSDKTEGRWSLKNITKKDIINYSI